MLCNKSVYRSANRCRSGPIPENLRRHEQFVEFQFGLPEDGGLALPPIRDGRILIIPVVLGYMDLVTDVLTADTYYRDGHIFWFFWVLFFSVVPTFIVVFFFLPKESWGSKLRVVTHTSLMYEFYKSAMQSSYSPTLALLRRVEPLFESLPQTFLQLYALMLLWNETASSRSTLETRLVSVSISVICLAYTAAGLCTAEALVEYEKPVVDPDGWTQKITRFILKLQPAWLGECFSLSSSVLTRFTQRVTGVVSGIVRGCLGGCCTFIWHLFEVCAGKIKSYLSRITPGFLWDLPRFLRSLFPPDKMKGQTMELAVVGSVSKATCSRLCFVYHIMEISSRFLSLALVAVDIQSWILLLLALLFAVRYVIVCRVSTDTGPPPSVQPGDGSQGAGTDKSQKLLRLRMRIVATPFLDSIFEGKRDYEVAVVVTLVEFVGCLIASALRHRDSDELPSTERETFAHAAVGFMVGKMVLAWFVILPLKRGDNKATVEERLAGTGSIEGAAISHVSSEEQPVPTIGSEDALERGDLGRVRSSRIGSAAIWGEKNDEATEGELRTDDLATLPVR